MDESDRLKKKIQPPNPTDWNNQMYRMRVFSSLVRDTDRNLTNVLITPEWKVMMIDFTRGVPAAAGADAPEGSREDRSRAAAADSKR